MGYLHKSCLELSKGKGKEREFEFGPWLRVGSSRGRIRITQEEVEKEKQWLEGWKGKEKHEEGTMRGLLYIGSSVHVNEEGKGKESPLDGKVDILKKGSRGSIVESVGITQDGRVRIGENEEGVKGKQGESRADGVSAKSDSGKEVEVARKEIEEGELQEEGDVDEKGRDHMQVDGGEEMELRLPKRGKFKRLRGRNGASASVARVGVKRKGGDLEDRVVTGQKKLGEEEKGRVFETKSPVASAAVGYARERQ